jgi:stage II sporulation protein D
VRVLLEGKGSSLDLSAERIRAFDSAGRLLGEWDGAVRASAEGDLLRIGGAPAVSGAAEVAGTPSLAVGGRRVACPVRLHARGGTLLAVAVLPMEGYVASVLSREAAPSFRPEALKAMAVAIRSYTETVLAAPKAREYDLLPGVEDQVFDGDHAVPRPFAEAAEATAGTVLLRDGAVARAVYHSTCGGRTEGASDAWEGGSRWPPSVPCDDCRHSPAWRWVYRMGEGEAVRLFRSLGVAAEREPRIEPARHTGTGRLPSLVLSAEGARGKVRREVKGADFRRAAGYGKVKSLAFEARRLPGGGLILSGKGYGHGVGLCQWGADGMARKGARWEEILARYYPGAAPGAAPRR